MKTLNKHKVRLKKASFLAIILLVMLFPAYLMNFSNFTDISENFSEDSNKDNEFNNIEDLKPSVLGNDTWWDTDYACRQLITITNPYPYDFENYGLSVTFDYTTLGENIQSDLDDIRIVENGVLQKYHVKKDYPTTDMATVWFDTNINDTIIGDDVETDTYMYFGNDNAPNAEAINPADSFGWIKNGDFELEIDDSSYFNPYGWNFSHNPIDSIYGESNPGVTSENSYGVEFANRLVEKDSLPPSGSGERVYNGQYSYKFGAAKSTLSALDDVYNSYAGAFFSYPFTVPKVYGAGISLHLYRNMRTWGFITNSPIDDDGYYIRLCDNYDPDPDVHTDIGVGFENYIEIWGGRAFTTGPAQKINSWQHPTKVRNWEKSVTKDTFSPLDIDGELTAPLNFTIGKYEGDTIFLEIGVWGQESKYHTGFFQLDDVRFNYTDFSTSLNELQYINSTVKIITRDIDGRIVPNVEVMLVDSTLPKGSPGYQLAYDTSDSNGRVIFRDLENRRYNITANYTLGSREVEVFNSFELGTGPYYFNGIFYTEDITLDLWTIDFEVVDWDGIPLSSGYVEVNESGGDLLETLTLDENGKAIFRWLYTSDYYFSVYYDNDDYYGNPLLLNESYIRRSNYDKSGDKYQECFIWVNNTNTAPPGTSYSVSEYVYTNGSRTELGNKKLTEVKISLTNMIDQLENVSVYYIDKDDTTGTSNHLIYFEDGYGPSEDSDIIELDIPLIENTKLESENYDVYGLLIEVNGVNYSNPCNGVIKVETIETCNIYNKTHLTRIIIQTIDTFGNPISSVVKITDIANNSQSLINLTASSTTTNGYAYDTNDYPFWYLKDRTYNFTIDAYDQTNIEFNISYVDPPHWKPSGGLKIRWYNYTLTENSTIIFVAYMPGVNISNYITSFANSSGTGDAYWGEFVSFSVIFEYTDDNGQNWYPVTNPVAWCMLYISEVGENIDLISEIMVNGTGAGNFTITLNSSRLSAGGSSKFYNVRIEGSYPGYPDPNSQGFFLEVKSIPTTISAHDNDTQELPTKLYTMYYDELVSIMIQYSVESGDPLLNAHLSYTWRGLPSVDFTSDPIHTNYYSFTLNTSDAQTTGLQVISISASLENYTALSFSVYLNILERKTTLNDQSDLVYFSPKIWVQDAHYFTFYYADANTLDILGGLAIATYSWYELDELGDRIPGSQGSGTLIQNINKSYYLDFNSELRSVGFYFLHVALQKENYEPRFAYINFEIKSREFDVAITGIGSNNQVKVDQGDDVELVVNLIDLTRGNINLEEAQVTLNINGVDIPFSETTPGVYTGTIGTSSIDTFFTSKTLVGKMTIEMANFTSQEISITVVVEMEEIFPGMPTFYFILITASVIGVVGSLVGYRVIQQARIPKHVKKIRKIKGYIKSKKKISETLSIPTKEEMTAKLFGNDWKELGLSIDEALGIQDLKTKKSPIKDKINKEGGEIF